MLESPSQIDSSTGPSDSSRRSGRLEAIWLKRVHRGPMIESDRVAVTPDHGLEGNVHSRGRRQVAVLSADAWAEVEARLGRSVDPIIRRANLFVRGLDFERSRGRTLRVGACRLEVLGELRPCRLMDDSEPGLCALLGEGWRGGVYGRMLDEGEIAVGDAVTWSEA